MKQQVDIEEVLSGDHIAFPSENESSATSDDPTGACVICQSCAACAACALCAGCLGCKDACLGCQLCSIAKGLFG